MHQCDEYVQVINVLYFLASCTMQCEHVCSADNIAPPIQSARLESVDGFAFKYGRVEIRAKLPTGDWLWPAIWMLPKTSAYGIWPRSGHMNVMESRGNPNYVANGKQIGVYRISSVMHYGPDASNDAWATTAMEKNSEKALNQDFHLFQLMWAPSEFEYLIWIEVDCTDDTNLITGRLLLQRMSASALTMSGAAPYTRRTVSSVAAASAAAIHGKRAI